MSEPLAAQEYVALTALRAMTKALRRVNASGAFRDVRVADMVASATNVLCECVREIESCDSTVIEQQPVQAVKPARPVPLARAKRGRPVVPRQTCPYCKGEFRTRIARAHIDVCRQRHDGLQPYLSKPRVAA